MKGANRIFNGSIGMRRYFTRGDRRPLAIIGWLARLQENVPEAGRLKCARLPSSDHYQCRTYRYVCTTIAAIDRTNYYY